MAAETSQTYIDFLYERTNRVDDDKIAIIDHSTKRSITYGKLKQQVQAVGSALRKRGFCNGQFLTLFVSNCLENAALAHGAMATGGTVHLMKPSSSNGELIVHLQAVQPRFVVCTQDLSENLMSALKELAENNKVEEIFVVGGSTDELFCDPGDANPMGEIKVDSDNDVALLLLTGGTTGASKLVMATHAALKIATDTLSPYIDEGVQCLTYQPFYYVSSILATYSAWLTKGITIVSIKAFDAEEVLNVIEEYQISSTTLFPSPASAMINSAAFDGRNLSSLTKVIWGGAPISRQTEKVFIERFEEKSENIQFIQWYGMTEALLLVSNAYPHHRKLPNKGGTAGVAIPSVEVKIVSVRNTDTICKANEKGQVVIRTPSIMKGYFKNKGKTDEVLKDGWYYTGDYGWLDEEGFLFVVDRIGDLIYGKNGKIIVPSKLEAIICSHKNVEESMVVGKKENDGSSPVAFIVRKGNISTEEIENFVKSQTTADQWITGGIRFVKSLPKSPAGKLLRQELIKLL